MDLKMSLITRLKEFIESQLVSYKMLYDAIGDEKVFGAIKALESVLMEIESMQSPSP